MLEAIKTALAAWTGTAQAVNAYLSYRQSEEMKQAGIDAQRVIQLEAALVERDARIKALVAAAGTPGSNRL